MKKNKKINIPNILFVSVVILGIFIIIYPVIVNYLNEEKSKELINKYNDIVSTSDSDSFSLDIKAATEYNNSLYLNKDKNKLKSQYNNLLNINSDGMMGYIKIPKLGVQIPIYHGVEESVLQKGVGHLEDTSLPVGGKNTHSVLSGHRGLSTSKLFTDLDQMKVGDMFYIYIYKDVLAYKVDEIKVVEPYEVQYLNIIDNEDYVTLVTCTPYAINTHRLLVRGTRVEYNEEELNNIPVEKKLSEADKFLFMGLLLSVLILFIVYIILKRKK